MGAAGNRNFGSTSFQSTGSISACVSLNRFQDQSCALQRPSDERVRHHCTLSCIEWAWPSEFRLSASRSLAAGRRSDAVVLGEIIDDRRPAAAIQIRRRSTYHTHIGCELTRRIMLESEGTEAKSEIVSSFDKVHQAVGRLEVNP